MGLGQDVAFGSNGFGQGIGTVSQIAEVDLTIGAGGLCFIIIVAGQGEGSAAQRNVGFAVLLDHGQTAGNGSVVDDEVGRALNGLAVERILVVGIRKAYQ